MPSSIFCISSGEYGVFAKGNFLIKNYFINVYGKWGLFLWRNKMSGGLVLFKQQQTNLPEYNTLFGMPVKLQTTDDLSSVFSANNLTFSPEIRRTDLSSRFKGLNSKFLKLNKRSVRCVISHRT